jgi:hypothetical protein
MKQSRERNPETGGGKLANEKKMMKYQIQGPNAGLDRPLQEGNVCQLTCAILGLEM